MAAIWLVNDRDLRDFDFVIDDFNGPTDGPELEIETQQISGRFGSVPISPEGTISVRELTCKGHIRGTSPAVLKSRYDTLLRWCKRPFAEIRTGLDLSKVFYGWYRNAPGGPVPPQLLNTDGILSLTYRCLDVLAYDQYERVIGPIKTSPVQIPQGTGPVAGVWRVRGPTTSPLIIIVRDHAGRPLAVTQIGTTANPFTLGANDRVEINHLTGTIQKFASGVMTDAMEYFDVTSDFPAVIGEDAFDSDGPGYATVEVSSGLGSGAEAECIVARTHLT